MRDAIASTVMFAASIFAAAVLLQPAAGAPLEIRERRAFSATSGTHGCGDMAGKNLEHLDRFPVQCPVGTALEGWRVEKGHCPGAQQKITPRCTRKVQFKKGQSQERATSCEQVDGKKLEFLDRHGVICPAGTVLTSWRLSRQGCSTEYRAGSHSHRVIYNCSPATVKAETSATASTPCDSVNKQRIDHLDRHAPHCSPGSVLTKWQLTGAGCKRGEQKIEFTCTLADDKRRAPVALGGTNDGRARDLQACVGECDNDGQCGEGLKCFERDGFTPVPGCIGHGKKDWNYCYDPLDGRPTALVLVSKELSPNTMSPWPAAMKLEACQGDCDRDDDCGAGLKCWKRDGNGASGVPGCDFGGKGDKDDHDYCYDPASEVGHLVNRGSDPSTATTKLQACQGDCNDDGDCANGFVCFKRDRSSTPVPGCAIGGPGDIGTHNYCVDPHHGQHRPGATVHERASKLSVQPAGSAPTPAEVHAAAAAECASRGQYLCSEKQSCDTATRHNAGHSQDGAWTAIGGPGFKFMYVPKEGEVAAEPQPWDFWGAYPNTSNKQSKSKLGCRLLDPWIPAKEARSALFSCCGDPFAGAKKKPETKLHAIELDDLVADLPTAAAAEWRAEVTAAWRVQSGHVFITTEYMLGVAAEAQCEIASSGCMAQIRAEVRSTLRSGLTGSTYIGGVPVIGEVYVEFTAGATATATASVGQNGAELGVEASVDASATYGATISGELHSGVAVGADGAYTVGASATASNGATVTLEEVSVEAELQLEAGVSVDGNFELASEHGHGVAGGASVCAGCAGVGFNPSFKMDGCSLTVGAEGSGSLGVGASFSGAGSVNFCSLGGALADAAEDVGKWALHGIQDTANGFVEPFVLSAVLVGVHLPAIAGDVAEDTEWIANEIADGTVQLIDDTGAAFSSAAEWSENAAKDAGDWFKGAGSTIANVVKSCFGFC